MTESRYPVIDTHCLIGVNPRSSFIAEEELIPYMESNNIDIQVVFQLDESFCHETPDWNPYIGNDYVAKIQKMFSGKVIGLATVNPWYIPPKIRQLPYSKRGEKIDVVTRYVAMEELERSILKLDLHGLRIHSWAQITAVNDPKLIFPLMERLTELQREKQEKLFVLAHGAGDSLYNAPDNFADLARSFPDLLFIMGHAGFIWGQGTLDKLAKIENLLIDITLVTTPHTVMGLRDQMGIYKMTIGTYHPFATMRTKLTILDDVFKDENEKALVLGGNLAKRLGMKNVKA